MLAAAAAVVRWQEKDNSPAAVSPPANVQDFVNQTLAENRGVGTSTPASTQPSSLRPKAGAPSPELGEGNKAVEFTCTDSRQSDFDCYKLYYDALVRDQSIAVAFADLRQRYEENSYVRSQCHPLAHVIGNEAAKKFTDVSEAYKEGDNFCSSGYYHGALEGFVGIIGYSNLAGKMNSICQSIASQSRYSLSHHNCTHGLGHGLMAVTNTELFESLRLCDDLTDTWERSSCYGGVFMENIIFDGKYHSSKYLRLTEPLYPCNAVEHAYAGGCYLIQTAYMLKVVNGDFKKVFELCSQAADEGLQAICYQSLGRDASGWNLGSAGEVKKICLMGRDFEQQSNCIIGGVKDMVWYFYSEAKGKELCAILEDQKLKDVCNFNAESYYKTF